MPENQLEFPRHFLLRSTYSRDWTTSSKIINLRHIANNLPEAFTDYKGVTKSSYPARNAPERVEVPIKTIQLPLPKKTRRSTAAPKDNATSKRPRVSRAKSSKSVNPSQPQVGRHPIVEKIQHQDQIHNPDQRCIQILILGYRNTLTP